MEQPSRLAGRGIPHQLHSHENKVGCFIYVLPSLLEVLNAESKSTLTICKNSLGKPYPSENAMRKAWQDFKARPAFKEVCPTGADLTLHGLRVTYGSDLKDKGFSDEEVAQAIGDKSTAMGKHNGRGKKQRNSLITYAIHSLKERLMNRFCLTLRIKLPNKLDYHAQMSEKPFHTMKLASWRSGDAADCKSVYAGSIPAEASTFLQ